MIMKVATYIILCTGICFIDKTHQFWSSVFIEINTIDVQNHEKYLIYSN